MTWDDLVKGPISISNHEIDDLVIVRADGVPTYNFCVVVDDWDMSISHVFRGDEHVNNTPWQINIFNALGAPLPLFGHVPVILGDDGQKLSKRRGAVSVVEYRDAGYLPDAMLNYLARLGWSHGDEELFTRAQMVEWFDGSHLSKSPAQWDVAKLNWVNAQAIKHTADAALTPLVVDQLARREIVAAADDRLIRMCGLFKDRCHTTAELAEWLSMYFVEPASLSDEQVTQIGNGLARGRAGPGRQAGCGRLEQGRHRRRRKGCAGGTAAQDGPVRAGCAPAGVRPGADPVARRGARAVSQGHRAHTFAASADGWL